ncbi:hypothetical protein KBB12_02395 [Candidatus Woesebacteria bacterium]|nr:hypothetical protein [Candidatus Woesebacteria bacterium]
MLDGSSPEFGLNVEKLKGELAKGAYLWDPSRIATLRNLCDMSSKPLVAIDLDGVLRYLQRDGDASKEGFVVVENAVSGVKALREAGFVVVLWTGNIDPEGDLHRQWSDHFDLVITTENYDVTYPWYSEPDEEKYLDEGDRTEALRDAIRQASWIDAETKTEYVNRQPELSGRNKMPEILSRKGGVLVDDLFDASEYRAVDNPDTYDQQSPVLRSPGGELHHFWVHSQGEIDLPDTRYPFDTNLAQTIIQQFSL